MVMISFNLIFYLLKFHHGRISTRDKFSNLWQAIPQYFFQEVMGRQNNKKLFNYLEGEGQHFGAQNSR